MKTASGKIIAFLLFIFFGIFFSATSVFADTPLEDITLNLSVETQDLVYDFADEGEIIQKERVVIYSLEVVNEGISTLNDLHLFMDDPDYMEYISGSSSLKRGLLESYEPLEDNGDFSPLASGYFIKNLGSGDHYVFQSEYQVKVPDGVLDDPLYTVAWASLVDRYSTIPVMSNPVNSIISGLPTGVLSVQVTAYPNENTTVFTGSMIVYRYTLRNSGGLPLHGVTLVDFIPEGTVCVENCGTTKLGEALNPGEAVVVDMKVEVKTSDPYKDFITNIGFDASATGMEYTEVRQEIRHPLNSEIHVGDGNFTLMTEQVPNLVLNSPNGQPRADRADVSETQYAIVYSGRGKTNTFDPTLSGYGVYESGPNYISATCGTVYYDHGLNSTVYAYNSGGGGCSAMNASCITSAPLEFDITTTLPDNDPDIVMLQDGSHTKTELFTYGDTAQVNRFMKIGGLIETPGDFTLSRAVGDGSMGKTVSSIVSRTIREDLWKYTQVGSYTKSCHCDKDGCSHSTYPIYQWQLASSSPISTLSDDDTAQISVYSSSAWLKTEGGHVGTNGAIINNETAANRVNLGYEGGAWVDTNQYVYTPQTILTPTSQYTPFGATNSDYMIFANRGNEAFASDAGESWVITGTDFGFLNHGDAYDRTNNPRDYTEDLLNREKFGKVFENELPSLLRGTIDISDGVIWKQNGNLYIGTEGIEDKVLFTGGQSRIYVEGDVYINADIGYAGHTGDSYNDITSLRIDARNIYVDSEVTDLEVLLQARENFYSGEGTDQLRILGDVIAGNAHWQRKPVLELNPDEVNKPSEYIIEDMRKYVIPVPGDTELPDEYDIWRQVNPGTGQVLDSY